MKLSEVQGSPRMRLSQVVKKREPEYRVTDDMGTGERLLAGIGGGMVEAGRKVTNLVLPDALTPEWASDKAIADQAEIDKDLDSTGAGMAGKILGETALSAPVGGAAGGVLKGALAARRGLRGTQLAKAAAQYGPGRAAVEGAVEGAMLANPDERLEGAAFGGASGGVLGGAAKLAGKTVSALTPKKTEGAKRFQRALIRQGVSPEDAWVPLSQGADEGVWKQFYQGIVANLPGGQKALRGQFSSLEQSARQAALRKAAPWVAEGGRLSKPSLPQILQHGDDVQAGLHAMDQHWDHAWEAARLVDGIQLPKNWKVPQVLVDFVESKGGSIPAGKVSGRKLLDLKESANMVISKLKSEKNLGLEESRQLYALIDDINSKIHGKIKFLGNQVQNREFRKAAEAYRRNLKGYSNWLRIKNTAEGAGGRSEFTMKQLLAEATSGSPRGIYGEGGVLQDFGKLAETHTRPFPSNPGIYQMAAAAGLLGGGTLGYGNEIPGGPVGGALLGLGTLVGGSKALSTRAAQKMLMGEFGPKSKLFAQGLRRAGRLGRSATIPAYLENQDEP